MRTAIPVTVLPLALLCGSAVAAPQPTRVVPSSPGAATQGVTVVRDADTGALRAPTPAEMQALRRQAAPATAPGRLAPPSAITGLQGELSVELGERGLVYAVVKRGADGKLDRQCVDSARAATRILAPATPAAQEGGRHDHR